MDTDQQQQLDRMILSGHILGGLRFLIDNEFAVGLGEAQDIFVARYQELRGERAHDFESADEDYWSGFYS